MKEIIAEYKEIFDQYGDSSFKELIKRGFCFQYDTDNEGKLIKNIDVLFIGINPSYTDKSIIHDAYTKENINGISYFKAFEKLLNNIENNKLSYTHLDLLAFRETKQSYISDVLLKSDEGVKFIVEQLEVSKKLIEEINPKVIVVSNTMARRLLGKEKTKTSNIWLDYDFEFNTDIGTDIISSGLLKNTPVFFSSMLSGQRALDNGSKERLAWHIEQVLNFKYNK